MVQNTFIRGILWFLMSLLVSNINDVISKYLGNNLHPIQTTFMRFLFGSLVLLPFMVYFGRQSFETTRPLLHFFRGLFLFGGIALWNYGLTIAPITVVTLISFTIPLFVLILAKLFLKEQVGYARFTATIVCFIGVSIVLFLQPLHSTIGFFGGLNPYALILLVSAFLFASLDIINKKYIIKETMLSMLFYSTLITTLLGVYPTMKVWIDPTPTQYILLFTLGCGANLLLYFLLKCFTLVDASAVAPFRYFELVVSAVSGFLFFREIPTLATIIGSAIVIPSTLYIARYESRRAKLAKKL
jgi:S-adenosylmethionine uptake transporter